MLRSSTPDTQGDRLMLVNSVDDTIELGEINDLAKAIAKDTLLVLNDSATLPASLRGAFGQNEIELRLTGQRKNNLWQVLVFGEGDHRTTTEERPRGPKLRVGDRVEVGTLVAVVREEGPHPRLAWVQFVPQEGSFWQALYKSGAPIQYAYATEPLALWDVQTPFASRPWSVEMPSAARPFTWSLLEALQRHGAEVVTLTHAAGLSSTGDAALDAQLPFDERYEIPQRTADAIARAKARGARVVAVGTSVVRALESCAADHEGEVVAKKGIATLRLSPSFRLRVVDALITGVHEPGTSHWDLLGAFANEPLLGRAALVAEREKFRTHEWGDTCLIGRFAHVIPSAAREPLL